MEQLSSKKKLFGIDGGGTNTRIRIIDENNNQIGFATGKSSNIYSVGKDTAFVHLKDVILTACKDANILPQDLQYGCIGSAGLQRDYERRLFKEFFESLLPQANVKLCTDAEIMLVGGLNKAYGYSLTCGTGSIAMGRNPQGELVRAGGLGYMLGDEGSALWIAYESIKRSLRSVESRDLPTKLLPKLLDFFALKEASDFIRYMHYEFDKASIASACPIVFELAKQEDALAIDIIEKAHVELLKLVKSVLHAMPLADSNIVLGGGVFEKNEDFFETFVSKLKMIPHSPKAIKAIYTADYGALMLAREWSMQQSSVS